MKKSTANIIACLLVFLSLGVSIFFFVRKSGDRVRRTFEFESTSVLSSSNFHSKFNIEERYFLRTTGLDAIKLYIDEFLLGPITEQSRATFPLGTKAKSVDFSNGTLFIDLSSEALINAEAAADAAKAAVLERTKSGDAASATVDPNAEAAKARALVLSQAFDDLLRNVKRNFPRVHNLSCSIEGVNPLAADLEEGAPNKAKEKK